MKIEDVFLEDNTPVPPDTLVAGCPRACFTDPFYARSEGGEYSDTRAILHTEIIQKLYGYCDSDYVAAEDRECVFGNGFILNNGIVAWQSQKQITNVAATIEAE
jgi:hypothetical protein